MFDISSTHAGGTFQINQEEVLARMDGDCQLLSEICDLSLAELPRMMNSLREAVQIPDANLVHRAAHRLKGSLSVFGPGPHIEDCEALEEMALNRNLAQAPGILSRMERHLSEFSSAVAELGKDAHARADRR